jgi:hypothetical protein
LRRRHRTTLSGDLGDYTNSSEVGGGSATKVTQHVGLRDQMGPMGLM